MSNIYKLEPFPPQDGQRYSKDSNEYKRRLIYITARVEDYLKNFRDSVEYDFTRLNKQIEDAQAELNLSMGSFAAGFCSVDTVKNFALILRNAFKRPEQTGNILNRADFRKPNKKPVTTEEGYVTGSFYIEGVRATFGERLNFWIRENNRRLFFAGETPPTGVTSCMVEGGGGFDPEGNPLSQYEAERRINEEVKELLIKTFGGKRNAYKKEPEAEVEPEAEKIPEVSQIKTGGKTPEQIKAERDRILREKNLNKYGKR